MLTKDIHALVSKESHVEVLLKQNVETFGKIIGIKKTRITVLRCQGETEIIKAVNMSCENVICPKSFQKQLERVFRVAVPMDLIWGFQSFMHQISNNQGCRLAVRLIMTSMGDGDELLPISGTYSNCYYTLSSHQFNVDNFIQETGFKPEFYKAEKV